MRSAVVLLALVIAAQADARARDLGIPFEGTPGPLNAITDVAGVEVGHETLIEGDGYREAMRALADATKFEWTAQLTHRMHGH